MLTALLRTGLASLALGVAGTSGSSAGVRSEPPAHRVISLIPSVTDFIVALGAGDRLVGRTNYDSNPLIMRLPSIGGTIDPSVERILSLHPDLIISWRSGEEPAVREQLDHMGVTVRRVGTERLSDMRETIDSLGRWLGIEARAAILRAALDDTLAAVSAVARDRRSISVLYVVGISPVITAGRATFIDDLITTAGGRNVFADASEPWPTVSLEAVVARNPDVIILPSADDGLVWRERFQGNVSWQAVRAVRAGDVMVVNRDLFDRPGPLLGAAARRLSDAFDSIARHQSTTGAPHE